jgi:hypothetical protein
MLWVEGVAFSPTEFYVTFAEPVHSLPPGRSLSTYSSNAEPYYMSLAHRSTDYATTKNFVWRWDTDWFWNSRLFGTLHGIFSAWTLKKERGDVNSFFVHPHNAPQVFKNPFFE